LDGEKITSVDKRNNTPGTEFKSANPCLAAYAKKLLIEPPYLLGHAQRQIMLNTIKEVCMNRLWVLLAAHVRTNHVHIVIHTLSSPINIMNTIKAYASRRLIESSLDGDRAKRWTRHGSTRYLWKEEDVESTIQYVVHEQGNPMAVFENLDRSNFGKAVIAP
jgi:REP element-mobilizing transposase RayT